MPDGREREAATAAPQLGAQITQRNRSIVHKYVGTFVSVLRKSLRKFGFSLENLKVEPSVGSLQKAIVFGDAQITWDGTRVADLHFYVFKSQNFFVVRARIVPLKLGGGWNPQETSIELNNHRGKKRPPVRRWATWAVKALRGHLRQEVVPLTAYVMEA